MIVTLVPIFPSIFAYLSVEGKLLATHHSFYLCFLDSFIVSKMHTHMHMHTHFTHSPQEYTLLQGKPYKEK